MAMCSTLVVESALRLRADGGSSVGVTTESSAAFKNVTGTIDTSALRESYFNDSVIKTEDTKPVYETRTVMITLSKKPIADRSKNTEVGDYVNTWDGERAQAEIAKEQQDFLQALKKKGIAYSLKRTYNTLLNAVAVELDTKYVSSIKEMKGVDSVVITSSFAEPQTADTQNVNGVVTNETDVYETGIYDSSAYAAKYGEGMVVAVLDTGLDYTHEAFAGFQSSNVDYAWNRDHIKAELANKNLKAEERSGSLEAVDVYVSEKVPFAYDYADDDPDVYPSYSNHGTHVAGIIGGYHYDEDEGYGYTDKDGNKIDKEFIGVVPDAQLMICKVFTDDLDDPDLGGAVTEDIVAALEDCVTLGVDVINMSLGSSCGFTTTNDGDDEGELLNAVYSKIGEKGISLICAASNDYSAGYGGVYGTNLASNPDAGTVGSPSTFAAALSVASINGQKASYLVANGENEEKKSFVFFEEARDINSNPFDFVNELQTKYGKSEFEYVVVPGVGASSDYTSTVRNLLKDANGNSKGRIALVKRGDNTFQEKVEIARDMGAIGVIIYNNVAGMIRMNLGEIEAEKRIPAVSINMNAGAAMIKGATSRVGKITMDKGNVAGPFMSEFSSWGPTPDLKLKPEITAHGGEITSAVPGGYNEQSGTSMATPNMAGFMAIVRSYLEKDLGMSDPVAINRLAMQLTMSTAGMVRDQDGLPYSPRKQGAGVAKLENVLSTNAYLWTDNKEVDNRPKVELGADTDKNGEYTIPFKITNFGDTELSFKPTYQFMTETLSSDKLTVSEQAHILDDATAVWLVGGDQISANDSIKVGAGKSLEVTLRLTLGEKDRKYIEQSFENGMYVEGFATLISDDDTQCDLTLPFLGFYGDWDAAPMLDYSAYEVAANEQDASVLEEDKIKASVWATQPYNIYYNDKYVLPMGGYLYLLPDDADPMYVDEDHNSVSRYNDYNVEDEDASYMTTTGIKAVYAGLLRNARVVNYKLYDEATGEVLISDSLNRVAKAYSGGGSAVPANVKLELMPEIEGLVANGTYRMTFDFFKDTPTDANAQAREEDSFEFSFTVDYEAPVMEDVRVRYYNYKDGNKEKQSIFLDIDVYDNHYAQTLMLCYPTKKDGADDDLSLMLATEYPTPIRNAVKNGVTTVSLDITDIYEKYGSQLYVQLDDYALNSCLYEIDMEMANAGVLPEGKDFSLAQGEDNISLDIYETHKTRLIYGADYKGSADLSNFQWTSANPQIAGVKNGEIVGLSKGSTKVFVSNYKGGQKVINVTVSDVVSASLPKIPSVSFGLIQTDTESLQKADGSISVNPGKSFKLSIEKDPWYHPMTDLQVKWTTDNADVATVDQQGNVVTKKKGTAVISATVMQKNAEGEYVDTLYSATSIMYVQNEFDVSNYTLNDYNGLGGTVVIPTDLNVMYIGEEAFKDNNNITKIIIPSSVIDIRPRAFYNCTALEEVYFVSETAQPIADADVSMIYEEAFYGCTNLKKVDFSNVKTVTIAENCFKDCTKLTSVVDMPSIGTMHHRAFANTGLTSVDISGLHMSGDSVFEGCKNLTTITKTGAFTAIGMNMFKDCVSLKNVVTLSTPNIGEGAFSGCINLAGVKLQSPEGKALEFNIGARAFEYCGTNVRGNFYLDFGTETVRSIGTEAFAGSTVAEVAPIYGLEVLGENAFLNTQVDTFYLSDDLDIANIRLTGIPFEGLTVRVAENSTKYFEDTATGVIYNADKSKILYANAELTGAYTVEEGVTAIGDYAFANSKITSITLADSVNSIGIGAFKKSKLASIDFKASTVTEIAANTFEGSMLASIVLPDSVESVGDEAFKGSAIASFKGDKLLYIGNSAFASCKALTEITLADGIESMGNLVFQDCTNLVTVTLPSVKTLGRMTFFDASSLQSVTFGANAKTVGAYTFMGTPIESVVFKGNEITEIATGAFYGCTSLTSITLPESVTRIEGYAFSGATSLASVVGIENVEYFGVESFYNTALTELNLSAAKHIGSMAFATFEDMDATDKTTAKYTSISIPVAERVESFAFYNGGVSSVTLPKTLKTLGEAAFASSDNLATVEVETGSKYFFAEDNVLYRYTNEAGTEFELVYYPTARVEEGNKGERSYTVKEGTVRIMAYAFYGLKADALNAVVLPYSINAIGDGAFFVSGVTEYTFESIQAPALETSYRQEVRDIIKAQSSLSEYKGYYYNNFQTYLYHFTQYGGQKSPLVMRYPSNGTGYNNPIYSTYFGTKTPSANALIEDDTRACISLVTDMPEATEIATWVNWDKTDAEKKAYVKSFAETLKTARIYYNNAVENADQVGFISKELATKLEAVEGAFRAVKSHFEIPFVISELRVAEDSQHKKNYISGETFDMTGLSMVIVYDDYSVAEADSSKLVLLTNTPLIKENVVVRISYEGTIVLVPITVVDEVTEEPKPPVKPEDSSSSSSEGSAPAQGGCKSEIGFKKGQDATVLVLLGVMLVVGIALAVVRRTQKTQKKTDIEKEIHIHVNAVVHEKNVKSEDGKEKEDAQLRLIVDNLSKSPKELPEGSVVKTKVQIEKK